MASQDKLTGIIEWLIKRDVKMHRKLKQGLVLAYTPASQNKNDYGVNRLALSRKGSWPSDNEINIVRSCLLAALRKQTRNLNNINVETKLKGRARNPAKRPCYHVIHWTEIEQTSFL